MKERDRLFIDNSCREVVELVKENGYFNFSRRNNKDQFMFALALGIGSGLDGLPIDKKEGWFWVRDLKDDDLALIKAAAVYKTNNPEILQNYENVYLISEEYANLGFRILKNMIEESSFDTFEKEFEASLHEMVKSSEQLI